MLEQKSESHFYNLFRKYSKTAMEMELEINDRQPKKGKMLWKSVMYTSM